MTGGTAASLINLLGFITGLVLYVMLLWMVLTSRPGSNSLTLLTGVLGFAWNAGAFGGYGLVNLGFMASPLLLATHNANARSGGSRYRPTISRTFSSNFGSLDNLNFSTRCGWTSKRRQTRCTIIRETLMCLASVRTLQCVPSGGLVFRVVSRIVCSNSGVSTDPMRLRFRLPVSASTPPWTKADRVVITVGRDKLSC